MREARVDPAPADPRRSAAGNHRVEKSLRHPRGPIAVRARRPRGHRGARARRRLPRRRAGTARRRAQRARSPPRVRAIMATQLSRADRLARADDVIDNSGPLAVDRPPGRRTRPPIPRTCRDRGTANRSRSRPDFGQNAGLDSARSTVVRDPLRASAERAHPHADASRGSLSIARNSSPRGPSAPDHHAALLALFEITDVAARADLKTDILQELERQKQLLAPLRNNPAIETRVLEPLLAEIDRRARALLAQAGRSGAHLRENEWLMTIKQRTAIPGGVCEFDLPAYHYWLNADPGRAPERSARRGSSRFCRSTTGSRSSCGCCATTAARAGRSPTAACSS